jgi:hypothetical protein
MPNRKATIKKKPAKKKPASKRSARAPKPQKPIGEVKHFYTAIKVAIVKFKEPVKVGARLRYEGATTKFAEEVKSMQFDHKPVKIAPKGKLIGLKVKKRVREGDSVFRDK